MRGNATLKLAEERNLGNFLAMQNERVDRVAEDIEAFAPL